MYNTTAKLTDHPRQAVLKVEVVEITVVDNAKIVDNEVIEGETEIEVQEEVIKEITKQIWITIVGDDVVGEFEEPIIVVIDNIFVAFQVREPSERDNNLL